MLNKYLPFLKKTEKVDPRLLVYPQKFEDFDISYPTISRRFYAAGVDTFIVASATYPLVNFLTWLFKDKFLTVKQGQEIIIESLNVQNPSISMVFEALNDQRMLDMHFMDNYIITQIMTQGSLLLIGIGFLSWFNYKYSTTPGKWIFGLRILNSKDYSRLTLLQAILRNIAYLLSTVTLFIPMIFARFELRKRALHDFIANTVVVRLKKPKSS